MVALDAGSNQLRQGPGTMAMTQEHWDVWDKATTFTVELGGRSYLITPDESKFGRGSVFPVLKSFEGAVKEAVVRAAATDSRVEVKDLVFGHLSMRAPPGEPDLGPPKRFRVGEFAEVQLVPASE